MVTCTLSTNVREGRDGDASDGGVNVIGFVHKSVVRRTAWRQHHHHNHDLRTKGITNQPTLLEKNEIFQ